MVLFHFELFFLDFKVLPKILQRINDLQYLHKLFMLKILLFHYIQIHSYMVFILTLIPFIYIIMVLKELNH